MKFSYTTQGFYSDQIDYGKSIPDDVIAITNEQYLTFFEGLNSGRVVYENNGIPTLSSVRPDSYQSWDDSSRAWVMTDEAAMQKATDEKAYLTQTASAEISRATTQISILADKIEFDDYDAGETTVSVKESLIAWKKYRIACNSVVNGAATSLPDSP